MFESIAYPKHSFLHGSDGNILESKTIVLHSSQWQMTIQSDRESKAHQKRTFLPTVPLHLFLLKAVMLIRIRDPVPFWPRDPE
jgi:hypothetical protein